MMPGWLNSTSLCYQILVWRASPFIYTRFLLTDSPFLSLASFKNTTIGEDQKLCTLYLASIVYKLSKFSLSCPQATLKTCMGVAWGRGYTSLRFDQCQGCGQIKCCRQPFPRSSCTVQIQFELKLKCWNLPISHSMIVQWQFKNQYRWAVWFTNRRAKI